jgi:hypothetical protein
MVAKLGSPRVASPRPDGPTRRLRLGEWPATMRLPPDEIEQRYQLLPPISLAWLKRLKELGVSVDGLCEPELPGQAQVVMHDGFLFDFADEADGTPVDAVIFLARDEEGEPADVVAWGPRSKRLAAWYGAGSLLGMENVFGPRLDLHNALAARLHRSISLTTT